MSGGGAEGASSFSGRQLLVLLGGRSRSRSRRTSIPSPPIPPDYRLLPISGDTCFKSVLAGSGCSGNGGL